MAVSDDAAAIAAAQLAAALAHTKEVQSAIAPEMALLQIHKRFFDRIKSAK
jgi:hypothetical protein